MTDLRDAARQALEAWEHINLYGFVLADYEGPMEQAIAALKAALEQPNRAQKMRDAGYTRSVGLREMAEPEQEPLSNEELDRLWREPMSADWEHREYARAIEAAHGIKE
jgi:cytolysin (calcineurin-like family phosphatase)